MAEWWREAVFYQIYPRSFQDTNGDGVGDLPGITRRLDHVADLGVDAVWLSPFFASPMEDFGYDVSDYRAVDPVFGTMADFEALLERAHELGLKLIIDQVYSHTSAQHAWFRESRQDRTNPRSDWYVWADPAADGVRRRAPCAERDAPAVLQERGLLLCAETARCRPRRTRARRCAGGLVWLRAERQDGGRRTAASGQLGGLFLTTCSRTQGPTRFKL